MPLVEKNHGLPVYNLLECTSYSANHIEEKWAGPIYKDDLHYAFDQSFCYGACESVYFILSLD